MDFVVIKDERKLWNSLGENKKLFRKKNSAAGWMEKIEYKDGF